jgi:preprotein translocase subunit SecG
MGIWFTVIVVLHVLLALVIIGLVLLQHGKGADMGSGFGGGASGSLFGATGSANFLSRTTAVLAALFFASSLGLTYFVTHRPKAGGSVMEGAKSEQPRPQPPPQPRPETSIPEPAPASGATAKSAPQAGSNAARGAESKGKEVPN